MKPFEIQPLEISVVVQGAIDEKRTPLCLESIRRCLFGAQIILSTWEGANTEGLDYDVLVKSRDPGGFPTQYIQSGGPAAMNNTCRQLLSTQRGLDAAARPYVLKIRSDVVLNGSGFLAYFDKYSRFDEAYRVFTKRILICNLYTRHSYRSKFLFHPSDWALFGTAKDIKRLFDVPFPDEPDGNSRYFCNEENRPANDAPELFRLSVKYCPEQYFFVECLKKHAGYSAFRDYTDVNSRTRMESDRFLMNNFVVLDYGAQFDISFKKYDPMRHVGYVHENGQKRADVYGFHEWLERYSRYFGQRRARSFGKTVGGIYTGDISVVVQGAVDKTSTARCLASVRRVLPGAQVILSTWENTDVCGLDFDEVVFCKDPGAVLCSPKFNYYNNLNRQLLSTVEGLEKCARKYAMKLRSDNILTTSSFLKYFRRFPKRCGEFKLFEERLIVPTIFSRKHFGTPQPFRVCDWFTFGLTSDVKKYYMSIDPVKEPEFSLWFQNKTEQFQPEYPSPFHFHRFTTEQYYCLNCFQKYFPEIHMEDLTDFNAENIQQSEVALANNFIFLEYRQHGIYLKKADNRWYDVSKNEARMSDLHWDGFYRHYVFLRDYKKHCDQSRRLPKRDWISIKRRVKIKGVRFTKKLGQWALQPVFMAVCFVKIAAKSLLNLNRLFMENVE